MSAFSLPVRVYWEDTDAQGVVYYGNYFRFMERARTEWLRARGVDQQALRQQEGVVFVVIETGVRFSQPARLDEVLDVEAQLTRARGARFVFRHVIRRGGPDGPVVCEGHCEAASLDAETFKPRRLPPQILGEPLTV